MPEHIDMPKHVFGRVAKWPRLYRVKLARNIINILNTRMSKVPKYTKMSLHRWGFYI